MSRRWGWPLLLGLLPAQAACDDGTHSCTLDLRFVLGGETRDAEGELVTADRVQRIGPDKMHGECMLRPGGYLCPEGGPGRAQILVSVGKYLWTQSVLLRQEPDGCHDRPQTLDFTLDGLKSCAPARAVEGALLGLDGMPTSRGTIKLTRPSLSLGAFVLPPEVDCLVEQGHYRCDAISYYSDADYVLRYQSDPFDGDFEVEIEVHVPAEDCQVETVQRVLDLSREEDR